MARNQTKIVLSVAMLLVMSSLATAEARVTVVNHSKKPVFMAIGEFLRGQSSSPAGEYSLPVVTPNTWFFQGWWEIRPGDSKVWEPGAGYFYFESSGNPIQWNLPDYANGYVTRNKFAIRLDEFEVKPDSQAVQNLKRQGFYQVKFVWFDNGTYTIR